MRIRVSKESEYIADKIGSLYQFKSEALVTRIAFALSIQSGKEFDLDKDVVPFSDGREFRDDKGLFGSFIGDTSNTIIFKTILDQHYNRVTYEEEFIKLFKLHLSHGLTLWNDQIGRGNITSGDHVDILIKHIKNGLALRKNIVQTSSIKREVRDEFDELLTFIIGYTEEGEDIEIRINDLRAFDNRNIAIAGMAGSGKTQLVKDMLYQISKNSESRLKFIFFDYKGEGNPEQLSSFLKSTNCAFVDIVNDGGLEFNPLFSISSDVRQRPFSIRAFADTVAYFVPSVGVAQKNILINVLTQLFDNTLNDYPTIEDLFAGVQEYYENNNKKPDTLFAGISDLATNIFNCNTKSTSIFDRSVYLNLPPALSDTLRQLIVFLLLRYFNFYFSSTNDCEPVDHIFPLRYVVVIDEAHIYLKNKNARKALEELLRLLRSKGVMIIMLSQGVEDYKTKDFDFASQVKLPICLNVQNKDYKAISNFIGTPSSKYKLETEIGKLESGKGLINLGEPKTIGLRQWWMTQREEGL